MQQFETLWLVGTLVGGLAAWKAPIGELKRLGWRVGGVCFVLLVLTLLLSSILGAAGRLAAAINWVAVAVLLVLAVAAVTFLRRRGVSLPTPALGEVARAVSDSRLEPDLRPFVGKTRGGRLRQVSAEDTIGVIGPPRSGKTAGILIPQAMQWAGPMISVSVREDILTAVGDQRLRIARPGGGGIHVFDPAEGSRAGLARLAGGRMDALPFVRWSPLEGCQDAATAKLRAEAMVWASVPPGSGAVRHVHFERLASMILRNLFHAAALSGRSLEDVLVWIDSKDYTEPAALLDLSDSPERRVWGNELLGLRELAPEERGSAFSTAANALDAFKLSAVQRNCSRTDLDLPGFLRSRSSLFVIAGVAMQNALAPLFSAMLESVAFSIIDQLSREQGGRLDPPLLLQLDEVANIAPLPNLEKLMTLAGGSGICIGYASQNWQQLAARYGQDQMRSIWQSTKAQVVFGGVGDAEMLRSMSEMMGRKKVVKKTRNRGALSFLPFQGTVSVGEEEDSRLHLDEIFQAQDSAFLFYKGDFERVSPANYYDPVAGRPFHEAAGWAPDAAAAGAAR